MASLSLSASLSPSLPFQSSSLSSTSSFPCPAGNRLGNYSSPIALFGPHRALRIIRSDRRRGQEWERPKPGRRPDIFPQFSPMKSPLPPPMPADPPEEDEEEEEEKEEEEEEEPEKEEKPENPE